MFRAEKNNCGPNTPPHLFFCLSQFSNSNEAVFGFPPFHHTIHKDPTKISRFIHEYILCPSNHPAIIYAAYPLRVERNLEPSPADVIPGADH